MGEKTKLGMALALGALAAVGVMTLWSSPKGSGGPPLAWQGKVTKVNQQIAVKIPVAYSRLMASEAGRLTRGAAVIEARNTLAFGVDFPSGWEYEVKPPVDGIAVLELPPLALLSEIKIEQSNAFEQMCNTPSPRQLVVMQESFRRLAREAFQARAEAVLKEDADIYELSRASIERHYIGILNQVNPPELRVKEVRVKFRNEPDFKTKPSVADQAKPA